MCLPPLPLIAMHPILMVSYFSDAFGILEGINAYQPQDLLHLFRPVQRKTSPMILGSRSLAPIDLPYHNAWSTGRIVSSL